MRELPSHVLADIFRRLSLQEKLCVLPCVCHAWRKVCEQEPGCWGGIVNLPYCLFFISSVECTLKVMEKVHRLARFLVTKMNRGFVSHFTVPCLSAAHMLLDNSTRLINYASLSFFFFFFFFLFLYVFFFCCISKDCFAFPKCFYGHDPLISLGKNLP